MFLFVRSMREEAQGEGVEAKQVHDLMDDMLEQLHGELEEDSDDSSDDDEEEEDDNENDGISLTVTVTTQAGHLDRMEQLVQDLPYEKDAAQILYAESATRQARLEKAMRVQKERIEWVECQLREVDALLYVIENKDRLPAHCAADGLGMWRDIEISALDAQQTLSTLKEDYEEVRDNVEEELAYGAKVKDTADAHSIWP